MTGYVNIKQILDNTLHHPLLQDVSFERAVNYAVQFIQIVGLPPLFEEKTTKIEVKEWRGTLPCDYYDMIQVRAIGRDCHGPSYEVFRHSTDSFHMSEDKNRKDSYDLTYKLQGNCIFTSLKEGTIEIAYRAMAVDDSGFPLIPENSSFMKALELYIKKEVFTILFDLGKINAQVLQHTEQQYAWTVAQAQSDLTIPSIDQMEALSNSWSTLIQRTREHSKGFKNDGTKELRSR